MYCTPQVCVCVLLDFDRDFKSLFASIRHTYIRSLAISVVTFWLGSAIHDQLIKKYTRDPRAHDYGIYLVFWFGADKTQPPPSGQRPYTAEELEKRLRTTLSADENRKISVCVFDVAKPD